MHNHKSTTLLKVFLFAIPLLSFQQVCFAQPAVPDDRTISFLVGESLREDARVSVSEINIDTADGIVTLSGSVTSLIQVRYAALISKKIGGVRGIVNQLQVQTNPRSDVAVADDVSVRIERNTASPITDLRINVKEGRVTLGGEAPSYSVGLEAALSAAEVAGVIDVVNQIQIKPQSARPDAEVASDIGAAFDRDVYLTHMDINVRVESGRVSLHGTVASPFQRERAGTLALRTANVIALNNQLAINSLLGRGERITAEELPDEELAENVTATLDHDNRINAKEIKVTARKGHVELRGHVQTVAERQRAEMDARDVVGAVWVTNLLSVRTELRDDRDIERDLVAALSGDAVTRPFRISAKSFDGVVTLLGTVDAMYPKFHASQLTGRVTGVRSVKNDILVRLTTQVRDKTLEDLLAIRLRSNWETGRVFKRIVVKVTSGRIVLEGDVDTFAQRREAGRIAVLMTGVLSVQNRLTVKGVNYPWEDWNDQPAQGTSDGWRYRGDFFERPGIGRG